MAKNLPVTSGDSSTIWEKPEPSNRTLPSPLTRRKIVRIAISLADKEGLPSVSLRKVGAALNAGPMRLYAYISTKEELLDLMVDALYEEMLSAGPLPLDWKEAMRKNARRIRAMTQQHPWFLSLMGGRPHQGPGALAHLESMLAVLHRSDAFSDIDSVLQGLKTIQAYAIGALQSEASELRDAQGSGLTKTEWQLSTGLYLSRMIASGRYPTIATVMVEASHPPAETVFEDGLERVLKGISLDLQTLTNASP